MSAPDWAALVQQTRDRIDQAEKTAKDADDRHGWYDPNGLALAFPRQHAFQFASWGSPDVALRMAAWARDVLDRHFDDSVTGACDWCGCGVATPCPDRLSVLRAWVPDLLTAAGVEP